MTNGPIKPRVRAALVAAVRGVSIEQQRDETEWRPALTREPPVGTPTVNEDPMTANLTPTMTEVDMPGLNGFEDVTPRVPLTSAGGRYDDGVDDITPEEFEAQQAEANRQRLANIVRDEQRLAEQRGSYRAGAVDRPKFVHRPPEPDLTADDEPDEEPAMPAKPVVTMPVLPKVVTPKAAPVAPVALPSPPEPEDDPVDVAAPAKREHLPPPPPAGVVEKKRKPALVGPIRRTSDGKTWPTPEAAAAALKVQASAIRAAIREGRKCCGVTLEAVPPAEILPTASPAAVHPYCKKVRRVDTGEIFSSPAEAGATIGVNAARVRNAISIRRTLRGVTFEYLDGMSEASPHQPIRCVETGEIFAGTKVAARAIGVNGATLRDAMKSGRPCRGKRYEIVEPTEKAQVSKPRVQKLPVAAAVVPIVQPTPAAAPVVVAVDDDLTFVARTMMAIGRSGATLDDAAVGAAVAKARQLAEAKRMIAAIEGGDATSMLAAVGNGKAVAL